MNIRDRLKHTAPPWGFWLSTLLLCLLVFAGCTGCGQKTSPVPAPMPAQHTGLQGDSAPTPHAATDTAETPTAAEPPAPLAPLQLGPDYNPHYGQSYYGITENNLKPPPLSEFNEDPLYWVPGWKVANNKYGEGYLVPPERYPGENAEKRARVHAQQMALLAERRKALAEGRSTFTDAAFRQEKARIGAEIFAEGLSNLHAAKYLASSLLINSSDYKQAALAYAEKAHEENPDDFHTLFLLAHLQRHHGTRATDETRAAANFRKLIAMNPNVARLYYEYGHADVIENWDESLAALEKSLALDHTLYYGDALRSLALSHHSTPAKAIEYLERWYAIYPDPFTLEIIDGLKNGEGFKLRFSDH